MTISITDSAATYTGDGSTLVFYVKNGSNGIYFTTSDELVVTIDGVTKTEGADYEVTGDGSASGYVTFTTAPADDAAIVIARFTSQEQDLSLGNATAFNPTNLMGALDRLTRVDQDQQRQIDAVEAITDYLPTPEAGKVLAWNDDGDGLTNTNPAAFEIEIGTVTTGAAGSSASAAIVGTAPTYQLDLTIPRGNEGSPGAGTGDVLAVSTFTEANHVLVSQNTAKTLQQTPVKIDSSGNITKVESLGLNDTDDSHHLKLAAGSDLSADRTLTIITGDANRSLTVSGDVSLEAGTHSPKRSRAYTEYTTNTSISTTIPQDDTIPQNTEGTEILSASITPTSSSNRVRISVSGFAVNTTSANTRMAVAVFRDSTANAIYATMRDMVQSSGVAYQAIGFEFEDAPATTSSTTYAVRVGQMFGGTGLYLNGTGSGRLFGGVAKWTIVLEEISV